MSKFLTHSLTPMHDISRITVNNVTHHLSACLIFSWRIAKVRFKAKVTIELFLNKYTFRLKYTFATENHLPKYHHMNGNFKFFSSLLNKKKVKEIK